MRELRFRKETWFEVKCLVRGRTGTLIHITLISQTEGELLFWNAPSPAVHSNADFLLKSLGGCSPPPQHKVQFPWSPRPFSPTSFLFSAVAMWLVVHWHCPVRFTQLCLCSYYPWSLALELHNHLAQFILQEASQHPCVGLPTVPLSSSKILFSFFRAQQMAAYGPNLAAAWFL